MSAPKKTAKHAVFYLPNICKRSRGLSGGKLNAKNKMLHV